VAFQVSVRGISASSTEALNLFVSDNDPAGTGLPAALSTFYNDYADHCNGSVSFNLEPEYREFNPATGQTIALHTFPGAQLWTQVGTASLTSTPDQTAVLVRWRTGVWVAGRQITGRTYLPYPSQSTGGGSISNAVVNDIQASATALVNATVMQIWSRKNGTTALPTSASVWNEYASQRRRRD